MEKLALIEQMQEKYSMLDDDIIQMALEAANWDTELATEIFEEQKREKAQVNEMIFCRF